VINLFKSQAFKVFGNSLLCNSPKVKSKGRKYEAFESNLECLAAIKVFFEKFQTKPSKKLSGQGLKVSQSHNSFKFHVQNIEWHFAFFEEVFLNKFLKIFAFFFSQVNFKSSFPHP